MQVPGLVCRLFFCLEDSLSPSVAREWFEGLGCSDTCLSSSERTRRRRSLPVEQTCPPDTHGMMIEHLPEQSPQHMGRGRLHCRRSGIERIFTSEWLADGSQGSLLTPPTCRSYREGWTDCYSKHSDSVMLLDGLRLQANGPASSLRI